MTNLLFSRLRGLTVTSRASDCCILRFVVENNVGNNIMQRVVFPEVCG